MTASEPIHRIFELFEQRGSAQYFGEDVSQTEHALQAAAFAEAAHCPDSLIAAALLHDFGHLVHDLPENIADSGIDAHHEAVGHAWLTQYFGPAVTEPIRLHVAAKRYLCAVDGDYRDLLSPSSIQSLALQGGPFTPSEIADFETNPFFRDAIQLRRFDDQAKIVAFPTPPIEHFRVYLERAQSTVSTLG